MQNVALVGYDVHVLYSWLFRLIAPVDSNVKYDFASMIPGASLKSL